MAVPPHEVFSGLVRHAPALTRTQIRAILLCTKLWKATAERFYSVT